MKHFIKYPTKICASKHAAPNAIECSFVDKIIAHLVSFKVGILDGDPAVYFEFDKRRYFREECCSYSGGRTFWRGLPTQNIDELAKYIIEGDQGVEGLCTSSEGAYPYEWHPDDLNETELDDPSMQGVLDWLVSHQSAIESAIKRYASNPDNYVVFDDYDY